MNLTEAISARRAVRSFTARQVDDAVVRSLLYAAVQAPSAMNRQPWLFSIVQDLPRLERYSDRAKTMLLSQMAHDPKTKHYEETLRTDAFNIFYNAPTLVVIGVAERGAYTDADCWLAAENLMLAACDAGLGSCCVGFAVGVLNTPEVKAELQWPPAGAAIAPLILGYPSETPPAVARAEPRIVSWIR
jgi:nitroreductase